MTALRKDELLHSSTDKAPSELYPLFKANAEAIGAKVYKCPDASAVRKQILEIAQSVKAREIVAAASPLLNALSLDTLVKESGLTLYFENIIEKGKNAEIGICEVDYGIVETGSLCMNSLDLNKRLVSSLPPVHIAIIRANSLLLDFAESLKLIADSGINRHNGYYTFISGPSRTSDIERVLTIGVHGPEELHIIFVPDIG